MVYTHAKMPVFMRVDFLLQEFLETHKKACCYRQ